MTSRDELVDRILAQGFLAEEAEPTPVSTSRARGLALALGIAGALAVVVGVTAGLVAPVPRESPLPSPSPEPTPEPSVLVTPTPTPPFWVRRSAPSSPPSPVVNRPPVDPVVNRPPVDPVVNRPPVDPIVAAVPGASVDHRADGKVQVMYSHAAFVVAPLRAQLLRGFSIEGDVPFGTNTRSEPAVVASGCATHALRWKSDFSFAISYHVEQTQLTDPDAFSFLVDASAPSGEHALLEVVFGQRLMRIEGATKRYVGGMFDATRFQGGATVTTTLQREGNRFVVTFAALRVPPTRQAEATLPEGLDVRLVVTVRGRPLYVTGINMIGQVDTDAVEAR